MAAAQSTGLQHTASGTPCQDSVASFCDEQGNMVIAVSDGAGSAPLSHIGSALAVNAAHAFLAERVALRDLGWIDAMQAAARQAQGAVVTAAAAQQVPLQHFACTLLLLALTSEGGGALQIGDGVMALRHDAQPWHHVFWPQKGEFVNATNFLTDVDAEKTWEVAALEGPFCDAVVMTDGLESLALQFANKTVHAGFFDGVMRPLRAVREAGVASGVEADLQAFLSSPRVTQRTDDDLTLVVASCHTP